MGVLDPAMRHVAFPNADVGTAHRQVHAGVGLAQRLLGLPEVGDVGAGAEPFDNVGGGVVDRYAAGLEPTVLSVAAADAIFHVVRLAPPPPTRPTPPRPLP